LTCAEPGTGRGDLVAVFFVLELYRRGEERSWYCFNKEKNSQTLTLAFFGDSKGSSAVACATTQSMI